MGKIIDGKKIAEAVNDSVVADILRLNKGKKKLANIRPNLAIVIVGERPDSLLYVKLKEREAKKVGIDTHVYRCAADIPEREIFDMIDFLNKDELIDAILVQLPLPSGYDTDGIILAIDPAKDVDRFHPDNLEILLATCEHKHVMPPLFKVVLKILEEIEYRLEGKKVCIVANSGIFRKSLAKVLECHQATVSTARASDKDLSGKTRQADVLITAVGRPKMITRGMLKKDAVVIDIGITKVGNKLLGDVDFKNCLTKCSYITPVPGGVGPLTIAMLFANTLELYKVRRRL